jgi:hypothetical protein
MTKFDRTFTLHDVEAIEGNLIGRARVFGPVELDGRVETLGFGAFAKALKDRRNRLPVVFDGEEFPGAVKADDDGLQLGVACDPKRALELAAQSLELSVQGRVVQESDEAGVRSITEIAVTRLELRVARPMADLVAAHEERLRAAGASEDAVRRTWEGLVDPE